MVREELQRFIQDDDLYKSICSELLDSFHVSERTVAAITCCGTKTGTAFLSDNFTRVFGYPRKLFIEGDLQFLIKHMHPDDLPAFVDFAERSTLDATPWNEAKHRAVHEHYSRIKDAGGQWMWIKQKVIILSVTPDRHIDTVLLLFDDCTAAKQAEVNRHVSQIEKSRNKSKLLDLLAPVSSARTKREQGLPAPDGADLLTLREKEILQLVSQGYSSKEIAAKLFISKHTVESHRKNILRKLHVKNAPQMVHQTVKSSVG